MKMLRKKICLVLSLCFLNNLLTVNVNGDERVFSFQTSDQLRQEKWRSNGTATGFFGWTDINGEGLDIEFIADENGYRVIKKKNKLQGGEGRERNPRDRQDEEEFEFDVEEGAADAYSFRYDTGTSFREESKRGGVVFGKYGYLTADGKLHVVKYTASRKRGYVPIREIRDAIDYTTAAAEPISPLPLRRMRELAAPPNLWPIENTLVTEHTFIDASTETSFTSTWPSVSHLQTVPVIENTPAVLEHSSRITANTFTPVITSQLNRLTPHSHIPQVNHLISRGSRAQVQSKGIKQFSYNLGRQFHRQDQLDNSSVRGQYGWRDAAGILRIVHYVADSNGFKVFKNNSLSKP